MKNLWEKLKNFVKEQIIEPIEDFFVGLWKEFLEWLNTPWTKLKNWITTTALPWLAKGWYQIVNMVVLFIAYGKIDEAIQPGVSVLIGGWIFVLLAYYIFWKLLGADKIFDKMREDRKRKNNKTLTNK